MPIFLRRHALGLALGFLYLYSFPYFEEIHSANELPRVYLTMAMVDDGTFAIDHGVARFGATVDVSPSGGHQYSNKAPGTSFFAVPAYLGLRAVAALRGAPPTLRQCMWTFRVWAGVLPTLAFLVLLWRFLARYAPTPAVRRVVVAGYALGTMAMTYSVLFIAHQLSAICIASAYIVAVYVVEDGKAARWLLAAGFLAGCAPLMDYQAAFAGVPIAAYLVWRLGRARRFGAIGLAVAGSIPPIALLLFYHARAFGSPFRTGYAASETFAHFHQQGFLGLDRFRPEALYGSTLAADNGLFFLSPLLLLALPGFYLLGRQRKGWTLAVTGSIALIYLAFISSLDFWRGGWQMGPRYITAMLPFAMIPVAVAVDAAWARTWTRAAALALVVVSVVIYAVSCAEFPHFPEKFANPFFELVLRLLRDGHAPYNAGWLVGLRGLASLIPYLAVLAALLGWLLVPDRRSVRAAALAVGLATVILVAYGQVPGGGAPAEQAYGFVAHIMPH